MNDAFASIGQALLPVAAKVAVFAAETIPKLVVAAQEAGAVVGPILAGMWNGTKAALIVVLPLVQGFLGAIQGLASIPGFPQVAGLIGIVWGLHRAMKAVLALKWVTALTKGIGGAGTAIDNLAGKYGGLGDKVVGVKDRIAGMAAGVDKFKIKMGLAIAVAAVWANNIKMIVENWATITDEFTNIQSWLGGTLQRQDNREDAILNRRTRMQQAAIRLDKATPMTLAEAQRWVSDNAGGKGQDPIQIVEAYITQKAAGDAAARQRRLGARRRG